MFIKISLRFQYLYFKRFNLYFKDLACHSRGQSVPCGATSITNQKSRVITLTEETENMRFKTGRVRFQISGFLNIYMNFFTYFTEGVQDFRVVGDPSSIYVHWSGVSDPF